MINIGISRIALTIGPFSVGWYGIMVALAVGVVLWWVLHEVKRGAHISSETVVNAALVGIPSGIVLSRLFHVADHWDLYSRDLGSIVGGAGLTIWGGVLGATLGVWVYTRIKKISFGYLTDLVAPGIILGQAIGRVGCTLNGCCYGLPTNAAYGIVYTNPDSYATLGIAYQPTQLYEIVYNLIAFGVLFKLRGRLKPDGSLFVIYLSLYSLWRFGIDFIREGTPFLFGLHEAQVISLGVLAITVPWLIVKARRARPEAAADDLV